MSEHKATIEWKRTTPDFNYDTYNREHEITFDNGHKMTASAAPAYKGKAEAVDPEEMLTAALSNCHMLTFLAIAAKKGLIIDQYTDHAVGYLDKDSDSRMWVSHVDLHPVVKLGAGVTLPADQLKKLHDQAQFHCFIGNSVKTEVVIHLD